MKESYPQNIEGNSLEEAFGLVLRRLRQGCGLSQEALGFESGYHRTYISLLERGRKSPSLQTLFNLSRALKIDPAELIRQVADQTHECLQHIDHAGE
ncbi:MAG: helix-turn-helix domain-containing protein [Syntrophobacterales bacterium]|nr:helix-turn-helix domain-containing protein [Syntrophobacterales bacterium]